MLTVSPLVTIDFFDAVYDRRDVLFTQPTMYMSCHKPREPLQTVDAPVEQTLQLSLELHLRFRLYRVFAL